MEKVSVEISITNGNEKKKYRSDGTYDQEKEILFVEEKDNLHTKMIFDLKKKKMKRQTEEYTMDFSFEQDKITDVIVKLQGYDQMLALKTKTEVYNYKERELNVKYQMMDGEEVIEYSIKF